MSDEKSETKNPSSPTEKKEELTEEERKEKQEKLKRERERQFFRRVRKKLTDYEWRRVREEMQMRSKLSNFQKEFRKHLAVFITGAFAMVAGLLWRDAITEFFDRYLVLFIRSVPLGEDWVVNTLVAVLVSFVAVIAIMIISKTQEGVESD